MFSNAEGDERRVCLLGGGQPAAGQWEAGQPRDGNRKNRKANWQRPPRCVQVQVRRCAGVQPVQPVQVVVCGPCFTNPPTPAHPHPRARPDLRLASFLLFKPFAPPVPGPPTQKRCVSPFRSSTGPLLPPSSSRSFLVLPPLLPNFSYTNSLLPPRLFFQFSHTSYLSLSSSLTHVLPARFSSWCFFLFYPLYTYIYFFISLHSLRRCARGRPSKSKTNSRRFSRPRLSQTTFVRFFFFPRLKRPSSWPVLSRKLDPLRPRPISTL